MLNDKAYSVAVERKSRPGIFWKVWSPYHVPHLLGVYALSASAQKFADTLNRLHAEGLLPYAEDIAPILAPRTNEEPK